MTYNKFNRFEDKSHEALMSVWWSGIMLKQYARKFFSDTNLASEAQFNVLLLLKSADKPLSQIELSEKLLVDKSNLTGLIDRLEKSGMLRRVMSPGDRRRRCIELTEEGERTFDAVERPYRERIHKLMEIFSDAEQATLTALMTRLQEELER